MEEFSESLDGLKSPKVLKSINAIEIWTNDQGFVQADYLVAFIDHFSNLTIQIWVHLLLENNSYPSSCQGIAFLTGICVSTFDHFPQLLEIDRCWTQQR